MPNVRHKPGTPAVGIDLGTTYSSLAYLSPQGEPVTLPNAEGELATPSIVFFDGNDVIVGTEALRHSVSQPERVVMHAKRHMGDPRKAWLLDGRTYRPAEISSLILKKLLSAAQEQLRPIEQAVITVPAQFSEVQRQATEEAGKLAGLKRVDIINEPTAAALCHILGEGLWFSALANEQTVLVFDLGGGTLDLSLVKYNKQQVTILATGGDLQLGGLDWNKVLETFACDQYTQESISDPRLDRESMQALAIEVEQVKRSLSSRERSTLTVQHEGRRKAYTIDRDHFEILTRDLVARAEKITKDLLKEHKLGWANINSVLVTGGASRMPMIRNMLQRISGTTHNHTLSPDQSICHGAAFYAGMLLSGKKMDAGTLQPEARQKLASIAHHSVCARGLGILVRDMETGKHRPHYLIEANSPIPCSSRQRFGTVIPNQRRVHVRIVESGTAADSKWVPLGDCVIEDLTPDLPLDSPVEVRIRYDEQARVHVEAVEVTSGKNVRITIVREGEEAPAQAANPKPAAPRAIEKVAAQPRPAANRQRVAAAASPVAKPRPRAGDEILLEQADRPIPLCSRCGEMLDARGQCRKCPGPAKHAARKPGQA